jgi:predicted Zn-dependent protease
LVTLLVSQNQADKAVTLLNETIKNNPKALYAQELLGSAYLATGKFSNAEKIFADLIAKNPKEAGFYRKQAQVYVGMKKSPQEIVALLDGGAAQAKDNSDLLALKAEYYQSINKPLDALAIYEAMLQKNPKSQLLQNNIAALILDYAPTKENLEKAQKLSGDLVTSENPALLDTVGWLQFKLGNYPQSLSLLQDARKKGSKGAVYDYHLGMAYYKSGNKQQAKELLQAALANDKENFPGKDEATKTLQELSAK